LDGSIVSQNWQVEYCRDCYLGTTGRRVKHFLVDTDETQMI